MKTRQVNSLSLVLAASLSGCAAVDAYNNYEAESLRKEREFIFLGAQKSCQEYGFKQGTDTFSACMQAEVNAILNREAIKKAARDAESILPKSTTCTKTLTGLDCTTK